MPKLSSWRDRISAVLLFLSAIGALFSFIVGIGSVTVAGPATKVVETWRMFGFVVFVGLFVLLALWPRKYAGVWELVIFHKVAVAITAAVTARAGAVDAQSVAMIDGILAVVIIVSYVLSRGYAAWKDLRTP